MTSPISANKLLHDTSGAALVEGAVVLPLFVLIIVGLLDLGLFFWQWNAADKAVHAGARRAIVWDPVASGSGLTAVDTIWDPTKLGQSCFVAASGCPTLKVVCTSAGCGCTGTGCTGGYALYDRSKLAKSDPLYDGTRKQVLAELVDVMKPLLPQLTAQNVSVTYESNRLGFVGRPGAVPADVTVSLQNLSYDFIILDKIVAAMGQTLPIRASATLPSEDLVANQ